MTLSTEARRVILLAAGALVLGSYTYLTTPGMNEAVSEQARQRRVLKFNPQEVVRVEVLYEGESLVCQRTPEGWKVEPELKKLRTGGMADFLQSLGELIEIGEVADGLAGLPEYGLDRPATRISLLFEEGNSRTLALGNYNPGRTSVYTQVDDTPRVVLVGSVIRWEVRKLFLLAKS